MTASLRRAPHLTPLSILLVVAAGCSPDRPDPSSVAVRLPGETVVLASATAPTTTLATTVPVTTGPPTPGATGAPATPTAAPVATTTVATTPPTTVPILALCDLGAVIGDIGPADAGYAFANLRCDGPWATLVVEAIDREVSTDEFMVLRADEGRWTVVQAGGATSCTSAGIPRELFVVLGCQRWEPPG